MPYNRMFRNGLCLGRDFCKTKCFRPHLKAFLVDVLGGSLARHLETHKESVGLMPPTDLWTRLPLADLQSS